MVWRYILAFGLSIIVLWGFLPGVDEGKGKKNPQQGEQAAEVVAVEPEQGAKGGAKPIPVKVDGEEPVAAEAGGAKPIPVKVDGEKPVAAEAGGEKPAGKKVDLVPGRFRVVVDPSRGSISGITLLNHFTAVEGDPEREEQSLLLESAAGATLLSMGDSLGPDGPANAIYSQGWIEREEELDGGRKQVVFEKKITTTGGDVRIRKRISPAKVDEFD